MKWRGQGILVAVVLIGAGAFAYQWSTVSTLEQEVLGRGIDYQPYIQRVSGFVEEHRRWPEAGEFDLPAPPVGGLFRKAALGPDGEILLTLSAWTITSGRARVVLAPVLQTQANSAAPGISRLRYGCLQTFPASLERIVCRSIGSITNAEVAEGNANAFNEWREIDASAQAHERTFMAAVATARDTRTQCDSLWQHAERDVIPCLRAIDATTAENFRIRNQQRFDGPRLRPEVIANDPRMLEQFNRECDESWRTLAAMTKSMSKELAACFDRP